MTSEALSKHFEAVADCSPIPVILYNVPKNTGWVISVRNPRPSFTKIKAHILTLHSYCKNCRFGQETIRSFSLFEVHSISNSTWNFRVDMDAKTIVGLSKHPNIVGMKESSGDIAKISEVIGATRDGGDFFVLAGSANFLLPALKVGAVGGICALANALPKEVCQIQQLLGMLQILAQNWSIFGMELGVWERITCALYGRPLVIRPYPLACPWQKVVTMFFKTFLRLTYSLDYFTLWTWFPKLFPEAGKEEDALALHFRVQAPNKAVTAQFGVPGLKHIMDQRGFYGGPLRKPLLPLRADTQIDALNKAFSNNDF